MPIHTNMGKIMCTCAHARALAHVPLRNPPCAPPLRTHRWRATFRRKQPRQKSRSVLTMHHAACTMQHRRCQHAAYTHTYIHIHIHTHTECNMQHVACSIHATRSMHMHIQLAQPSAVPPSQPHPLTPVPHPLAPTARRHSLNPSPPPTRSRATCPPPLPPRAHCLLSWTRAYRPSPLTHGGTLLTHTTACLHTAQYAHAACALQHAADGGRAAHAVSCFTYSAHACTRTCAPRRLWRTCTAGGQCCPHVHARAHAQSYVCLRVRGLQPICAHTCMRTCGRWRCYSEARLLASFPSCTIVRLKQRCASGLGIGIGIGH